MTTANRTPTRIQLRRTRGWRLPEGAVVVSRPTKYGNPYRAVRDGCGCHVIYRDRDECYHCECESMTEAREIAAAEYETHLGEHPELVQQAQQELTGKDLACWCPPDAPCHVDTLLRVANTPALTPTS